MVKADVSHVKKLELLLPKEKAIRDAIHTDLQLKGPLTVLPRHFWKMLLKQIKGKLR